MMESNEVIAPFVMKTYQMVNDSSLDYLIRWGTGNNSFIVVDSLGFSQRLLPAYFKHNNFSSFVRQLNTYGFRKVDPDRWEFANEWFLRGQVQLLKNIGRKRQSNNRANTNTNIKLDDEDDEEIVMEIARLKEEQKVLEQELLVMNKRIETTERRPEQMMALLCKVAEDPEILQRMMLEKTQRSKRRLITPSIPSPSSSSSSLSSIGTLIKREDNECYGYNPNLYSSPATTVWLWNHNGDDGVGFSTEPMNGVSVGGGFPLPEPDVNPSPAYPFSLLGGGF